MDNLALEYQKQVKGIQEKYPGQSFGAFQDGKIAVELMRSGADAEVLKKLIGDHSPAKGVLHPAYEEQIILKCNNVMKAYKDIIEADMEEQSSTPFTQYMYKKYANEIINQNPDRVLNGRDDQNIVSRMLGIGIAIDDIAAILKEASPVSKEAGRDAEKYVATVVEVGNREYEKAMALKAAQPELARVKDEYLQLCAEKVQGTEDKKLSNTQDGQIVAKMIANGVDKSILRTVVAENSPRLQELFEYQVDPYKYGYALVGAAEKVLERTAAIEAFVSKEMPESYQHTGELTDFVYNEYAKRMQNLYKEYGYISVKTDIDVSMGMMQDGVSKDEVKSAMAEVSPVIVEPGRGKNYSDYVISQAEERIEKIARLVERFKPIPREDKFELTADEYKVHMARFEEITGGKVTREIDGRFVRAMIEQGYDKKEIGVVVGKNSPCTPALSTESRKYGSDLVNLALKEIKAESVKEKGQSR